MENETILYLTRHGQTLLNATNRVQGWADSPLTPSGKQNIIYLGAGLKDISFCAAYSSDSGRAQETARLVLEKQENHIPLMIDSRIREWNFGSFEGELESLWFQKLAEKAGYATSEALLSEPLSYQRIAQGIVEIDEMAWAEPYDVIEKRVLSAMRDIAKKNSGRILVVSHGLTIAYFLSVVSGKDIMPNLNNGSVSKVRYIDGKFDVLSVNDTSYIMNGKKDFS